METSKPGSGSVPVHSSSVAALTQNNADMQTPLTALYIHAVPAAAAAHTQPQPYPPLTLPAGPPQGPATFRLSMLPLNPKEAPLPLPLPLLTLHIAGGLLQQAPAAQPPLPPAAPRPRAAAGKHVCPHCGRDCMKPSVLEKHLRCHTGERPYPCATCGVSFKTQSNLYKHRRTQAHARLCSSTESEHGSLGSLGTVGSLGSLGSQDSVCSSACGSGLSLDSCGDESGVTCCDDAMQLSPGEKRGAETAWALRTDPASDDKESGSVSLNAKPGERQSTAVAAGKEKQTGTEHPKAPPATHRHLPLQRQGAALFSRLWESSVSRGKSQSHDSTDSGFSESSDQQYPSPGGSVLHDHSMESLAESTLEDLEQPGGPQEASGVDASERGRHHRTLEERISRLISENSVVVEDKHLENVRPRKTVLSKQGSIDLPMPYTYKDSFHFDMRSGKDHKAMLDSSRKPVSCGSAGAERHAPLTRSSSLPHSVTLLSSPASSSSVCRRDHDATARSLGSIDATGFAAKSVDQHVSAHHPLVRQAAVDCHGATEEEPPSAGQGDRDGGGACREPGNRKSRRKKAEKFAYNKWYMYGAGTFKKLYNTEKGSDGVALKAKRSPANPEHNAVQGAQGRSWTAQKDSAAVKDSSMLKSPSATVCHPSTLPGNFNHKAKQPAPSCTALHTALLGKPSTSTLQFPSFHCTDVPTEAERSERSVNKNLLPGSVTHIPSDRKKQRTDVKVTSRLGAETEPNTATHAFHCSVTGAVPEQQRTHLSPPVDSGLIPALKGILSAPCTAGTKRLSSSPAVSNRSATKSSFLPKYQLKLPSAAGASTSPLARTLNVLTANTVPVSDLSSSHREDQNSLSITTLASQEHKRMDPRVDLLPHSHSIERTNTSQSIQDYTPVFPTTASLAVTSAERLDHGAAACTTFTVVHRRCTTITTTTASVQNRRAAKSGTASVQSSPSGAAAGSPPDQFARPPAAATWRSAFSPETTTAAQSPPCAGTAALSPGGRQHPPPVSHASPHSSTLQRTPTETETPAVAPCQLVRLDSAQPSAENVFHVHTPDLQICLQIISDEQLALMEPQIEREGRVVAAAGGTGGLSQRKNREAAVRPQVMCNHLQSSVTDMENASRGKQQEMNQTQSTNPLPPAVAAVTLVPSCQSPMPSCRSLQPLKQSVAKEGVRPDGSVSQDGLMSLNPSGQEKLIEQTTVSHLLHHGSQRKPPNAATARHVITPKCQPTGGGESRPDQHHHSSSAAVCRGGQALHGNISPLPDNNCGIPPKVSPQAAACSADSTDGGGTEGSGMMRCGGSGRAQPPERSQDRTPGESAGSVESTGHTGTQLWAPLRSVHLVEGTARGSSGSPAAGLMEEEEGGAGGSLAEPARPPGGTPGLPDTSAGRGLKPRQGAAERTLRRGQGQQSPGGATEESLQRGRLESDGGRTPTSPPSLTGLEARAANEAMMESCTHSWLAEEPHQHLSQIQFAMSDSRMQLLPRGVSNSPRDSGSLAPLLLGAPCSEPDADQLSQRCEAAGARDQQTQTLQTDPQHCLAQTQNSFRLNDVSHHRSQAPTHDVYLQNQDAASLALSCPSSLCQISTADHHHTLASYSTWIGLCPTEVHSAPCLSPGVEPSTSSCSHSVKVMDDSGGSGDGLGTLENTVHPLAPYWTPTDSQPGDPRDDGGRQTQCHTNHIVSPVTTIQGHTSHMVSPVTTLHSHTSHLVNPVTTLHSHTSHTVIPVTTLQSPASHIVSPVTTIQGHTSHMVNPVTTLQSHTSHTVSPLTTLSCDKSQCVSWPGPLHGYPLSEGLSGGLTLMPEGLGGGLTLMPEGLGGGVTLMPEGLSGGVTLMPEGLGGGVTLMPEGLSGGVTLMPEGLGGGLTLMPEGLSGGVTLMPEGLSGGVTLMPEGLGGEVTLMPEGLSGGVVLRPVPPDESSSSDDEDKLIIEL